MITKLPTYKDFEDVSKQCLTQALNLLYKVYADYKEIEDETIKAEVSMDNIWEHNTGTIRTSLILLHQGMETYMKSAVCKTSPFLLIEKNRIDWPTLPSRADKEFDSLYTISGEALLTTFCAVSIDLNIDEELIQFIENIRQKRNEAIHGSSKIRISAEELLDNIIKCYTIFFGKDAWFIESKDFNFNNPLFGYYDWDYEGAVSHTYLDFALDLLGKKILNNYLKINILNRAYFCPECKKVIEKDFGVLNSKWGFLSPNTPTSTVVHCVNCDKKFDIERSDCTNKGCKGNVIYDGDSGEVCLTCFEILDE